jgi:hypothetical protein
LGKLDQRRKDKSFFFVLDGVAADVLDHPVDDAVCLEGHTLISITASRPTGALGNECVSLTCPLPREGLSRAKFSRA